MGDSHRLLYIRWRRSSAIDRIDDLTKSEIIHMAAYLNEHIFHTEIIPQNLINLEILPEAEFEYQQDNPLKVGYHCALIEAVMDYKGKSVNDILHGIFKFGFLFWVVYGISKDDVIIAG